MSTDLKFVRVSLKAGGDVLNIPVHGTELSKQTLESQFVGAIGLKYESQGSWLAVPFENGNYRIPDTNQDYIVVTTSGNMDQARSILAKPNFAKQIGSFFPSASSSSSDLNGPNFNPRAIYKKDLRGNLSRKIARECMNKKKTFQKIAKVCFIDEIELPASFSKQFVLFEAMLSFSSTDDEDTLRHNLIRIWQNSASASQHCSASHSGGVTATDIVFLSYASRVLSIPITTKEFQWTGESLKSNIGQGKLYVMVKSPKSPNEVDSDNSLPDIDDGFRCKPITTASSGQSASTRTAVCIPTSGCQSGTLSGVNTSSVAAASSLNVTCTSTSTANHECDLEDFVLEKPKRKRPLRKAALRFRQNLGSIYSHQHTGHTSRSTSRINQIDPIEVIDSEDEELQQVLEESLLSCPEKAPAKVGDIKTLLKAYQGKVNKFDKQEIVVFRKRVYESASRALKKASFDVQCKLYVKFSGELGLDSGGPRREFFRLALHEMARNHSLFTGPEDNKIFAHNVMALGQDQYRVAGKLVAMSLAQDGPAMGFLNNELYMLMAGLDPNLQCFDLSLLPDHDVRHKIEELRNVDSEDKRDNFLSKHGEWMMDQGIQDVWRLKISDIPMTTHALVKQTIYYRTAAEIDQFCKGLEDVCMLMTEIKKDPTAWQSLFCDAGLPLSKERFLEECEINFSSEGSNRRNGEEETLYSFELFLEEIQEKTVTEVSFEDVLAFTTGAEKVPPAGFDHKIQIQFYDLEGSSRLPYVSTCALTLSLPRNANPDKLKEMLLKALQGSQGFGKC